MLVTLLGTCRLLGIKNHFGCTDIDEMISYVHSTREIIQLINFISGRITIPEQINRYCFRTGILTKKPISVDERIAGQFNHTDLFVIEISTMKNYLYKGHYLHHLAIDKRLSNYRNTPGKILKNTVAEYQDKQEIKDDIIKIIDQLHPAKILFVSHINACINEGEKPSVQRGLLAGIINRLIPGVSSAINSEPATRKVPLTRRAELINLVAGITKELRVDFFDPSVIFEKYSQEEILCEEEPGTPPGHYTELGQKKIGEMFAEKINQMM